MYDKIKALISRNDFTTAEKLLDRHSTDLSERQKRELRDFIAEQQRNKQRDDLKYMLIFNAIHKMEAFYYPWIEKES